jgi:hypothetical protein
MLFHIHGPFDDLHAPHAAHVGSLSMIFTFLKAHRAAVTGECQPGNRPAQWWWKKAAISDLLLNRLMGNSSTWSGTTADTNGTADPMALPGFQTAGYAIRIAPVQAASNSSAGPKNS